MTIFHFSHFLLSQNPDNDLFLVEQASFSLTQVIPETEFLRFYEVHRARLERAILSYARRDRELAKDALQHGLAAALEKFRDRELDEATQGEFLRYTITCAEHYIQHEWKQSGREPIIKDDDDAPIDYDPDGNLMHERLEQSIRELPESKRRAIQIRFFSDENLTLEQGAALFGKSVATFKRELTKAMTTLRQKMDTEVMA